MIYASFLLFYHIITLITSSVILHREAFVRTVAPEKGIPHRCRVLGVTWYLKELWPSPGSLLLRLSCRCSSCLHCFGVHLVMVSALCKIPQWCVYFVYTRALFVSLSHHFRSDSPPLQRASHASRRLLVAAMEVLGTNEVDRPVIKPTDDDPLAGVETGLGSHFV